MSGIIMSCLMSCTGMSLSDVQTLFCNVTTCDRSTDINSEQSTSQYTQLNTGDGT